MILGMTMEVPSHFLMEITNVATCQKPHRNNPYFSQLPKDQGDFSRHKCAGCAYELGYQAGYVKQTVLDMKEAIDSIQESQASEVRHISPLAAYAQGYVNGLMHYYHEHPEKSN